MRSASSSLAEGTIKMKKIQIICDKNKKSSNLKKLLLKKIKETGIKGYDTGANLFYSIPELNDIEELFIGDELNPAILAEKVEVIKTAIYKDGRNLQYASENLKTNKEIVEYERTIDVNALQVFDDERQASTIFRPVTKYTFLFKNEY